MCEIVLRNIVGLTFFILGISGFLMNWNDCYLVVYNNIFIVYNMYVMCNIAKRFSFFFVLVDFLTSFLDAKSMNLILSLKNELKL